MHAPWPPCQTAPNVNIVRQTIAWQQLNAFSHFGQCDDYLKDQESEQEIIMKSILITEPEWRSENADLRFTETYRKYSNSSGTSLGKYVRREEEPDLFMLRRWENVTQSLL